MSKAKLFIGFVPWIAYTVIVNWAGPASVPAAALLAFATAAALVVRSMLRGESAKILEVTGAALFACYAVVALAAPATAPFLAGYGRALSTLVLGVVIFASLPVRPFTEQFARQSVPQSAWHSPRFRAVNRRISAAWGGAVLVMGLGHVAATAFAGTIGRFGEILLNWGLPIAMILLALRYTEHVAAAARPAAS